MVWYQKPSAYELIIQEDYVRMYLDCEFELTDEEEPIDAMDVVSVCTMHLSVGHTFHTFLGFSTITCEYR